MNTTIEETTTGRKEPLVNRLQLTADQLCNLTSPEKWKTENHAAGLSQTNHEIQQLGGVNGIAIGLDSNLTRGIEGTAADIEERVEKYGSNKVLKRQGNTFCQLLLEPFEDTNIQILVGACIVSSIIGVIENGWSGLVEGVSIAVAIVIITFVTAINNYSKEKQFQELQNKSDTTSVFVFRNGCQNEISSEDLVVGDIIVIKQGMMVPADCILTESFGVICNESAHTGESEAQHKEHLTPQNEATGAVPILLQDGLITTGFGKALVISVGEKTVSGASVKALDLEEQATPLQRKLDTIALTIGVAGLSVAIATFLALMIRLIITICKDDQRHFLDLSNLTDLMDAFIIGVTVVVVAIPEGLPLAVTISLAYSVSKMAAENNLVKQLDASETMGGANEICTDKTGTLTQNRMEVKEVYYRSEVKRGHGAIANDELLAQCVLFNSTAFVENENGRQVVKGNATEVGLINYFLESGNVDNLISNKNQTGFQIFEIPFDSNRKMATSVVLHNGTRRVFVKGAPEFVIQKCSHVLAQEGSKAFSDDLKLEVIKKVCKGFADQAYRTLLVAYKDVTDEQWETQSKENNNFTELEDRQIVEQGLTMVGIFALEDPLRPGIRDAVARCRIAGINTRMCTGDSIDTAKAISLQAGIITREELDLDAEGHIVAMNGSDFRIQCGGGSYEDKVNELGEPELDKNDKPIKVFRMKNLHQFEKTVKHLRVLARSMPEDKLLLVTGLKEMGRVVAVTGDGTNDAPALKSANIGFAMGITGSDVAKNAAKIVLLDDNFCSIITAVKYGRNIYDSVRKFLQFQLTVNFAAMFMVFSGSVLFNESPLTAVQMLWVNLIMDTFAALALATEPPSDELLSRQPVSKTEKIVNEVMWRNVFGQAFYQITILLLFLFEGKNIFNLPYEETDPFYYTKSWQDDHPESGFALNSYSNKTIIYTMLFQAFVFMQIFNQINSRKLGDQQFNIFAGFFNNSLFLFITALTFGVQLVCVQFGGVAFRCAPLSLEQNGYCLAIGAFTLIWGVIIKLILPSKLFKCLAIDERPITAEIRNESFARNFSRQSTRVSIKARPNSLNERVGEGLAKRLSFQLKIQ